MALPTNDAIATLDHAQWDTPLAAAAASEATSALERGSVLFMPQLAFALTEGERRFLSPRWLEGTAKNVSFDPRSTKIAHTSAANDDRTELAGLMARFADSARNLVISLCPHYREALQYGLTSFRPVETE